VPVAARTAAQRDDGPVLELERRDGYTAELPIGTTGSSSPWRISAGTLNFLDLFL